MEKSSRGGPPGPHRRDLGRKHEDAIVFVHVQRLHAEAVSGEENLAGGSVVEREPEHSSEAPDRIVGIPMDEPLQEDFRVTRRSKVYAACLQFRAQFPEVVNLPVEYDAVASAFVPKGLIRAGINVEEREPSVGQAHSRRGVFTNRVRSAVMQATRTFLQSRQGRHLVSIAIHHAEDSAHDLDTPSESGDRTRRPTRLRQGSL